MAVLLGICMILLCCSPVYAADVPKEETPDYKVSYYAFDCFNMEDEYGEKYGYGYDMMQSLSNYMQCTFSYIGYEKSAKECEEMLRNGELDIYTAAKRTPEREQEFVFSTYPAITATTCMNVKRGNNQIVAGDYSTYNGLKIGLLERHTYNDSFRAFVKEKGFDCDIVYYKTPTELSNALIDGEVDALVDSYIRTPEDEITIENFGETPYYFMARKENQSLIDDLDRAIDEMNIETPNWRSELYNQYYGSQNSNVEFTADEEALLKKMQADGTVIRAVMRPDSDPYSWYEENQAYGIVSDLFVATAQKLGLDYEILPVSSNEEYKELISSGDVDVWMDLDSYYEDDGQSKYKATETYLSTTVSALRRRGSSGKMNKIGVVEDNVAVRKIIANTWPSATVIPLENSKQCVDEIVDNKIDCALMMSYTAQKLAREDTQNRLSVDIVPGATLNLKMGVNANADHNFYGLWEKALAEVSKTRSAEVVQDHLEMESAPTLAAYLFDHPAYFLTVLGLLLFTIFIVLLYMESTVAKNKQLRISEQLSEALTDAKKANDAKLNFFSKMNHDIRTPMNAVLGMTQIAKKYKNDPEKLENALENITSEGNYLLAMINSILDINQLEHGHIELVSKPFDPEECMQESLEILRPLAAKKEQKLIVTSNFKEHIVVGDAGRFSQIIVNIVSNAVKYTDIGGEIQVMIEALPDNVYRFTCRDNGIGMDEEFIQHICEDYMRAEDSQTSSIEGTGLGMSVVKGFTELMHGTLQIESELGKGSAFIVEIPFAEPSIKERKLLLQALEEEHKTNEELKGKKVLLVEDNALNAEIAIELMEGMGLVVDAAENGKIAVEKYENSKLNEYFVVFMDMQMPVMNGVEATKQIRASERADHNLLILAMTANTLSRDRKSCEEAGMNGYISKPINIKEIATTLKEYLHSGE